MQFDPWTFGLQAANFLVLVGLLYRFLYRPVVKIIGERQAEAAALIAKLDAREKAAEALGQVLDERKASLLKERDAILAEAKAAAAAERKKLVAAAESDADAVRSAAQSSLERERADMAGALGRDAARLAVSIVRRLLKEPPGVAAQEAMLELVSDDIQRLPDDAKQHIRERILDQEGAPEVVTAAPLDERARNRLSQKLAKALGVPARPAFSVDPELLAGVEVRFPFTILRRAWSADLKRIEAELIHDDGASKLA